MSNSENSEKIIEIDSFSEFSELLIEIHSKKLC
jgi:hypothetical protein